MLQNARSLQLAWFTTGAEAASALPLFTAMFGREPDAFQKLQPPQVPFPITVQAFVKDGIEHKLQTYSGRVDYIISGVQQAPELPLLPGSVDAHLQSALATAKLGFGVVGNINRAAVILSLAEKVPSLQAGADFFTGLFDGAVTFAEQTDLQFQMNSRLHGVGGQSSVNRLTRWTCDSIQFQQIVNLAGGAGGTISSEIVEMFYINYTIDVNTVPSADVISPSEQESLFATLADQAARLAAVSRIQDVEHVG